MLRNKQKVRITAFRTRFAISHIISCVVSLTKAAGFKQIGYYPVRCRGLVSHNPELYVELKVVFWCLDSKVLDHEELTVHNQWHRLFPEKIFLATLFQVKHNNAHSFNVTNW